MADIDPMAEIRASFFIECEELVEALHEALTALESGDSDPETINVCFRAVHSIKGGAGAFGLEKLVRFSHRYETVMDEVRSGTLALDHDALMLFFSAADVLSDLVRASRDDAEIDADQVESTLRQLEALVSSEVEEEEAAQEDFSPLGLSLELDLDLDLDAPGAAPAPDGDGAPPRTDGLRTWQIRFRPTRELFASGNEPLHLLRALAALGEADVRCDTAAVPPLEILDPEDACIGWTIRLVTEPDRELAQIEEIFEFVEGLCDLEVEDRTVGAPAEKVDAPGEAPAPAAEAAPSPAPAAPAKSRRLNLSAPANEVATDERGPADEPVASDAPAISPPDPKQPEPGAASPAARGPSRPEPPARKTQSAQPATAKATVRVDLDRIDRLVNLVGELVINQAMLSQSVAQAGLPPNSAVSQGLEEFMQLTRDIQDSVMMIRAQPVKSLFQRMSRIVRESSAAVGKRVRLVTEGDSTEVDKTVIERLADPLTHMIRNAVDHGLESGATRLQNGKSEEGCVTLTAAHRSGRVIIEVSDDGGGIDRPRVRAIAEKKGLVNPDAQLTDSEVDALLFMPGFSTASTVSDLSGRGVGMDVVRSSIQELGGRITITSEPGRGTTFSISLPLTLAVLDGMVVRSASETLVMPLGAILETLSLEDSEVRMLGPETHVLHIRDSFVPLLDLGSELGFREPLENYDGHVVLLITQEDGTRAALVVDSIEEQRQVVIKGLQDSYGHIPGIAAATILGDGQVALILDPIDLMANATGRTRTDGIDIQLAG